MVYLKQRKVVLSFYVFGNSFLTEVIPLPPPGYTICKAQKRKVEMSSGAAGNDEFMMITEGVRVSFTSLKWLCGAVSWQCSDKTWEGEVLVRLIQSTAHSRMGGHLIALLIQLLRKGSDACCCVCNPTKCHIQSIQTIEGFFFIHLAFLF